MAQSQNNESHCTKCNVRFAEGDLSIQCESCLDHYHRQCTPMTKAAYEAIGKVNNIHWFCDSGDGKIMGLISRMPKFVEKREEEAQLLTKTSKDLANLSAELQGLDVKKKLELFEGVTVCLGPKIQHMQDNIQKIDLAVQSLGKKTWSQVAATEAELAKPTKSHWNPEASVVINSIKDFSEAKNSSTIKTELSKQFKQVKFKSVMKRANGNIIIETEDKDSAIKMKDNWNDALFGGSSCRLTKKRMNKEVVLKDVPLPEQMARTGVPEEDLF